MDGGGQYNPRTVEEVFRDFKGRRAGMIKALTTDVEEFYAQCDPEKENLCLYGFPSEQWEVNLPAEEVPPELPEPALGINFARDGMQEKDWLSLVAVHSDAWLLAVAFYFGARFGFDKNDRYIFFFIITIFALMGYFPRLGIPTVIFKGYQKNCWMRKSTIVSLRRHCCPGEERTGAAVVGAQNQRGNMLFMLEYEKRKVKSLCAAAIALERSAAVETKPRKEKGRLMLDVANLLMDLCFELTIRNSSLLLDRG
ncbi:hypothetical protein HHK36_025446 [Tetracentron sinense]|uniref:PHD finger protein ALFIN-LIKE n=1 Tax=Tetracentron sinense TaxID=13715 RepID=A0A834YKG2_TETSI|nr:hypothetical protein HHK36_025446 [Tetracentron sinense]